MKPQKFSINDILARDPPKKKNEESVMTQIGHEDDKHIVSLPTPPHSPEVPTEEKRESPIKSTPSRTKTSATTAKRKRDPIGQILDSLCSADSEQNPRAEPSAFSPIITTSCFSQLSPLAFLAQCERRCYQSSPNIPTCATQLPLNIQNGGLSPAQISAEQMRYIHAQNVAHQQYLYQQQQQLATLNAGGHSLGFQQTNLHHMQMLREQQAKLMMTEMAGATMSPKRPCENQNNPQAPMWMAWFKGAPPAMTSLPLRESRIPPPPRYQCDACKKSYSTFGGLSKHKQFHCISHVKKEFNCKYCEKSYSSLGALKMHIRTHTLPCKCKLCGKAFSRPWLLQGHVRTHTGEKPFKCVHCGRAFADRSNLRAHLQTHSEIKKYGCKNCSKTFSRMSLLLKHEEGSCLGLRR